MYGSTSSSATILKDATGVEPGCVEIIPRNLVTLHVRTWLYSLHTDTRNFSDKVTCNNSKCVIHTYLCWYTLLRQKSYWNENYQILTLFNIRSMVCRDAMSYVIWYTGISTHPSTMRMQEVRTKCWHVSTKIQRDRCKQAFETPSHVLCDFEALAALRFRRLGHHLLKLGDFADIPSARYCTFFQVQSCWMLQQRVAQMISNN